MTNERPHSLIVGGTKGTGLALAKMLAAGGHSVSAVGRSRPDEAETRGISFHRQDLAELEALPGLLDAIQLAGGPCDNLIFSQRNRLTGGDPWLNEWTISVEATRRIVEHCLASPNGKPRRNVVVIGSLASRLDMDGQPVAYHAVRAALEQMVRSWAARHGRQGLRCNLVSPAYIQKEPGAPDEHRRRQAAMTPLGYIAPPEEIAAVIQFLCGPGAAYITGQNIFVDGGLSALSPLSAVRRYNANPEGA